MNTTRLVILTPEELKGLIAEAIAPYAEAVRSIEVKVGTLKYAYTVAEVAELIGYHAKTVLTFIREGRKDRKGTIRRLPCHEITNGDYRITPKQLNEWISHF